MMKFRPARKSKDGSSLKGMFSPGYKLFKHMRTNFEFPLKLEATHINWYLEMGKFNPFAKLVVGHDRCIFLDFGPKSFSVCFLGLPVHLWLQDIFKQAFSHSSQNILASNFWVKFHYAFDHSF